MNESRQTFKRCGFAGIKAETPALERVSELLSKAYRYIIENNGVVHYVRDME